MRRSTSRWRRYPVIASGSRAGSARGEAAGRRVSRMIAPHNAADCTVAIAARGVPATLIRSRRARGIVSCRITPSGRTCRPKPSMPPPWRIDKMPVIDIIDLITVEDRRVVTAVHRERERIAHGVEILVTALKKGGRIFLVGAGTSGRLGVVEAAEMPPTFGTPPDAGAGDHGRRPGSRVPRARGRRGQLRGRRAQHRPPAGHEARRHHRRVGERLHAVRPRRADRRAQEGRAHHLRHVLAWHRAAELRGPDHRAGRRRRGHRRLDAPQGRHGDQDGAEHADDDRDDSRRQDATAI